MIAPDHVRRLVLRDLQVPVVWQGMIEHWPSRSWSPGELASLAGDVEVTFRVGTRKSRERRETLWECDCSTVKATIGQFSEWSGVGAEQVTAAAKSPLSKLTSDKYWLYGDYMHMCHLFQGRPTLLEAVKWNTFGFHDRDGTQSTLWIGSRGAYTPCHYDTYGCNLVAQLSGRKKWYLFPPDDSDFMYPTRVPYEESSVYSSVCIFAPDLTAHPKFKKAHPYVVTLEPGQVLFVPMHWWHFVESLETSVSVNTWLELETDDLARVQEGITRSLVAAVTEAANDPDVSEWINPSEDLGTFAENLRLLNTAVRHVRERESGAADGGVGRSTSPGGSGALSPPSPAKMAKSSDSIKSNWSTVSATSSSRRPYTKEERCACCERRYEAVKPVPFQRYLDSLAADARLTSGVMAAAAEVASAGSGGAAAGATEPAAEADGRRSQEETATARLPPPSPRTSLTAEDFVHYVTHPRVIAVLSELLLAGNDGGGPNHRS